MDKWADKNLSNLFMETEESCGCGIGTPQENKSLSFDRIDAASSENFADPGLFSFLLWGILPAKATG